VPVGVPEFPVGLWKWVWHPRISEVKMVRDGFTYLPLQFWIIQVPERFLEPLF